jgi:hypothetical protein
VIRLLTIRFSPFSLAWLCFVEFNNTDQST